MKKIAILLFLFIKVACFAQTAAFDSNSIPIDTTIIVSVVGNAKFITQTQLDTGFYLQTNNPEIKIVQFYLGYWIDTTRAIYQEQIYTGNKVFINKKYPKVAFEPGLVGGLVFIDRILVEKNGQQYWAKALIITVKMPPRKLKQIRPSSNSFTKMGPHYHHHFYQS